MKENENLVDYIWVKDVPFKICFFQWRVWKRIVATDDNIKRMRICLALRCYCCEAGGEETIEHLFSNNPHILKAMEALCYLCKYMHG